MNTPSPQGLHWPSLAAGLVLMLTGTAYPLVFARVASFAARFGQAVLMAPGLEEVPRTRLQLYVDDPILTVEGDSVVVKGPKGELRQLLFHVAHRSSCR